MCGEEAPEEGILEVMLAWHELVQEWRAQGKQRRRRV